MVTPVSVARAGTASAAGGRRRHRGWPSRRWRPRASRRTTRPRSGRTTRTPVPKEALQAMVDYCEEQDGHHGHRQHHRARRVPGQPQRRTCRARRTTSSRGSPATACSSSPTRACSTPSTTSGPRSARNYSEAFKAASTGHDGEQYFVPIYNYPWVVIYRKSLFEEKGYTVPATWDEFIALADKMKADGLVPLAFGDKRRLAGDGHVRHPQHAPERLRLPRRPDGRHARSGPTRGSRPSSRSGASCCPYYSGRRPRA